MKPAVRSPFTACGPADLVTILARAVRIAAFDGGLVFANFALLLIIRTLLSVAGSLCARLQRPSVVSS